MKRSKSSKRLDLFALLLMSMFAFANASCAIFNFEPYQDEFKRGDESSEINEQAGFNSNKRPRKEAIPLIDLAHRDKSIPTKRKLIFSVFCKTDAGIKKLAENGVVIWRLMDQKVEIMKGSSETSHDGMFTIEPIPAQLLATSLLYTIGGTSGFISLNSDHIQKYEIMADNCGTNQ